ncbi:hypothetical protein Slin14017_G034510 [Septoria linicola]|nr:hypothetical protein Slin14017_G034510 [Septoria linicola]
MSPTASKNPRKRKHTAISGSEQDIHEAHVQLQLKPQHHVTFQALVTRHLQNRHDFTANEEISAVDDVLPFMRDFGPALFPTNLSYRGHLVNLSQSTQRQPIGWACRSGASGPVYVLDGRLSNTVRAKWRKDRDGRAPSENEEAEFSKLGTVLKQLFEAVLTYMKENTVGTETRTETHLIESILGKEEHDTTKRSSSRESSPDIPLVVAVRKRSFKENSRLNASNSTPSEARASSHGADRSVPHASSSITGPPFDLAPMDTSTTSMSPAAPTCAPPARVAPAYSLVDEIFGVVTTGQASEIPTTGSIVSQIQRPPVCAQPTRRPQSTLTTQPKRVVNPSTRPNLTTRPAAKRSTTRCAADRLTLDTSALPAITQQRRVREMTARSSTTSGQNNELIRQLQDAIASASPAQRSERLCIPTPRSASGHSLPAMSPLPCMAAVDSATSSFVVHNPEMGMPQVIATLPPARVLEQHEWQLLSRTTAVRPLDHTWTEADQNRMLAYRAAMGWMGGLPLRPK